jgi:heme-degrading monooxygenase HmoA
MYVNLTAIRVPLGHMPTLRRVIESEYLALARQQSGFVRSYLLEQIDDETHAQLVQVWQRQSDLEAFRKTGAAEQVNQVLHQQIPQLQMQSQGYIVRLQPEDAERHP